MPACVLPSASSVLSGCAISSTGTAARCSVLFWRCERREGTRPSSSFGDSLLLRRRASSTAREINWGVRDSADGMCLNRMFEPSSVDAVGVLTRDEPCCADTASWS